MDINNVELLGRVTSDLELKKAGEVSVINFSLATNRKYTKSNGEKIDEATFHKCVVFGKTAETMAENLRKGSKILVKGHLRNKQWEDKTGNKRFTTEVVIDELYFCEKKEA